MPPTSPPPPAAKNARAAWLRLHRENGRAGECRCDGCERHLGSLRRYFAPPGQRETSVDAALAGAQAKWGST